jgi:putative membrane protein
VGDPPVPVTADPLPLLGVALAGGAYARGTVRLWQQVGRGRVVRRGHAVAWALASLALLAAFAGPVEALSGRVLTAHMVQHLLLTLVAAPLLALSAPTLPLLAGVPHPLRRPAARAHARLRALRSWTAHGVWPFAVVGVYAVTACLWHLPGPYQAAVANDLVHAAEHASMLGAAVLLWWTVLQSGRRSAFGYGTGIAVVFLTALQHAALGGLLTLAPTPLYPAYGAGPAPGGMTPLADQQLAGTLMWAPSKILHGVVVVILVVAWLRDVDARSRRREAELSRGA